MDDKLIMGYVIAGLSLLLCAMLMGFGAVWQRYQYYKSALRLAAAKLLKISKDIMDKEERITFLKSEIKASESLLSLKDEEINELERKEKISYNLCVSRGIRIGELELTLVGAAKQLADLETQTPEWYKAKYLEMIQKAKNSDQLIELLQNANALYHEEKKQLEEERDMLACKLDTLKEEYQDYLAGIAIDAAVMPEPSPFGQAGLAQEIKPEEEPSDSEIAAVAETPADEPDVAVGC